MKLLWNLKFGPTLSRLLPRAVSVLVARKTEIMLSRRLAKSGALVGCWQGPGGHIDPNELPMVAAQREVSEEMGLNIPMCAFKPMGVKLILWPKPYLMYGVFLHLKPNQWPTVPAPEVKKHSNWLQFPTTGPNRFPDGYQLVPGLKYFIAKWKKMYARP